MSRETTNTAPESLRTSTREPETLRARLVTWLEAALGPASRPSVELRGSPKATGMSSETILFGARWQEGGGKRAGAFVLRLPPPEDAYPVFPRYDLDAQARVMRLVGERSSVPVPSVPWLEPSPAPLGAPFFIMKHVEGIAPPDASACAATTFRAADARERLTSDDLIYPVFVIEGRAAANRPSMPGVARLTLGRLLPVAERCLKLGVPAMALFPVDRAGAEDPGRARGGESRGPDPARGRGLKKTFPGARRHDRCRAGSVHEPRPGRRHRRAGYISTTRRCDLRGAGARRRPPPAWTSSPRRT